VAIFEAGAEKLFGACSLKEKPFIGNRFGMLSGKRKGVRKESKNMEIFAPLESHPAKKC
jgi:hypothetical protein